MPKTPAQPDARVAGDSREIRSAVCTRCGCGCDDVDLTVEGNRVIAARNACALGQPWFLAPLVEDDPPARVNGREVPVEEAAAAAADLLAGARRPLLWGLVHCSSEAQKLALELGDRLGGVVDPAAGPNQAAAVTAFQEWGEVNTTLGEVALQKSLIVLWHVEPERTHPRLLERWGAASSDAERVIRPGGNRAGGKLLSPQGRLDLLWTLRELARSRPATSDAAARGQPAAAGDGSAGATPAGGQAPGEAAHTAPPTGETSASLLEEAARLLDRLTAEPHAVLVFDAATTPPGEQHALRALAATLNAVTRFRLFALGGPGNRAGADAVLTWQTGFPAAVDFAGGAPRANGGEFGAARLLARHDVDAALVVCSDPADIPSEPALARLGELPLVVLDSAPNSLLDRARVALRSAPYGLASGGTFFRMDGVALGLRPAVTSRYPTEADWLSRILSHLPARSAPRGEAALGKAAPRQKRKRTP